MAKAAVKKSGAGRDQSRQEVSGAAWAKVRRCIATQVCNGCKRTGQGFC